MQKSTREIAILEEFSTELLNLKICFVLYHTVWSILNVVRWNLTYLQTNAVPICFHFANFFTEKSSFLDLVYFND